MKKLVVKLPICGKKEKQKAMKAVSSLSGVDSISVDMKDNKLTVIGDFDTVEVVEKLRKKWHTVIETVGPAEEPKKKEEEAKKEEAKAGSSESEKGAELVKLCSYYHPYPCMTQPCVMFRHCGAEEYPNSCCLC